MQSPPPNIAIIGAGLTGLVTAYYLQRAGHRITLFEQASRAGGVIETLQQNGFTWETGPNTGVLGKPEAQELFDDLGVPDLLETASPLAAKRYIWKGLRWHAIPTSPFAGLRTPLFSWRDKFSLLFEPWRPRGNNPNETLSALVQRRLGQSILDYAVDPFISGVYAGHPDIIIPRYALPKLYQLEQEYGSFLRGAWHKMRSPKSSRERKASRKTFSAQGGLQKLIDTLVTAIGPHNILLNCQNLEFSPSSTGWQSSNTHPPYSHVISTVGAHALPQLLRPLDPSLLAQAASVRYAPVAEIAVGFQRWQGMPLDGFGGLVPSKENRDLLGVLFLSSLLKNRAPSGGALFAVFVGGLRHPDYVTRSDAALRTLVAREFCNMMGVSSFKPDLFKIHRHTQAIPQYDISTPARLQAMESLEQRYPGLLIGGNGRDGIGMADRIAQGRHLAAQVLKQYARASL
jgi:protoporphyrinogen/coproporphyrinogen III oxidase